MFWYRRKRPDQGQEVILLQAFWEIKGPRAAVSRLSENQVQAASCILPASDAWPQVPNHHDQQEGKKKQGYVCTAGTSAEDGQPDHVKNQSPLNQSPAPLIPFFKRLPGLWAAPAQSSQLAQKETNTSGVSVINADKRTAYSSPRTEVIDGSGTWDQAFP